MDAMYALWMMTFGKHEKTCGSEMSILADLYKFPNYFLKYPISLNIQEPLITLL
jgi:hypothetical protein